MVSHLHDWVKAIREKSTYPIRCLTCQCRYLCREECLCVGMTAAPQHGDEGKRGLVCGHSGGGGKADEVIATARQFAALLMANGARLLEVPPYVMVSIVSGERKSSTLLN
jgi:hypothetical protein